MTIGIYNCLAFGVIVLIIFIISYIFYRIAQNDRFADEAPAVSFIAFILGAIGLIVLIFQLGDEIYGTPDSKSITITLEKGDSIYYYYKDKPDERYLREY